MPIDLKAVKERCDAATVPPWRAGWLNRMPAVCVKIGGVDISICLGAEVNDAEFIAHAREDVPALIAEIERLTRVEQALRIQCVSPRNARRKHRARMGGMRCQK